MKILFTTATVLAFLSTAALAQNESTSEKPIIKEETKEKVQEVKQEVQQGAEKLKDKAEEKAPEVKQEIKETGQQVKEASQELKQEIKTGIRSLNDRAGLSWYDKGSVFVGASIGFGLSGNTGIYLALDPRIGYFFQPGFMGGIRLGYDRRLSTSFRSSQIGVFGRYYPFRTRLAGFVGAGYNFGRERASNIATDEKARFNSITLELGAQFSVLRNLGLEASLETNYYDRSNPLAGRNRGGRARVGINYYFNRANR